MFGEGSRSWRLAIRQMPRVVLSQSDSPSSVEAGDIVAQQAVGLAVNA
jgi:hypothetical protein